MKIASSTIAMASSHALDVRHETRESLVSWRGDRQPGTMNQQAPLPAPQISESARAAGAEEARSAADNDPFILLLRTMIEWFTGEPVRIFDASQLDVDTASVPAETVQAPAQAPAERQAGFGIEYDYHALHEEFERTDFSAQGVVRTADGQEISFHLDVTMSRHYREETNVSVRVGDAHRKDPLVINFDGSAAELSSRRFRFDLDADGRADDVPLLGGGSGYLALDLNADGRIDSGAELFGPVSGSGFDELAKYDEDDNGWIDEADAVFARLRVWTPEASGTGALANLAAHGVGALYLGRADTAFELRGAANENLGGVRDSGIYLTDLGTFGTLQEIDLSA